MWEGAWSFHALCGHATLLACIFTYSPTQVLSKPHPFGFSWRLYYIGVTKKKPDIREIEFPEKKTHRNLKSKRK